MLWTLLKILCFLALPAGLALMYMQWKSIPGHEVTIAKVVALEPVRSNRGGPTYRVVAEYHDLAGRLHTFRSKFSSSLPDHKVGEQFPLMFERLSPGEARSLAFGERFGIAWGMIGVGLFAIWMSVGWKIGENLIQSHFPPTY